MSKINPQIASEQSACTKGRNDSIRFDSGATWHSPPHLTLPVAVRDEGREHCQQLLDCTSSGATFTTAARGKSKLFPLTETDVRDADAFCWTHIDTRFRTAPASGTCERQPFQIQFLSLKRSNQEPRSKSPPKCSTNQILFTSKQYPFSNWREQDEGWLKAQRHVKLLAYPAFSIQQSSLTQVGNRACLMASISTVVTLNQLPTNATPPHSAAHPFYFTI